MVFILFINVCSFLLWHLKGPYHIKNNNWWNLNIEPFRALQSNRGYFATPYRGYFATPLKWPPEPHFRSDMQTDLTTRLTDP